jgi:hypothetical protein
MRTHVITAVGALVLAGSAHAALIDIELAPAPDVVSGFLFTEFDSDTGVLNSAGFALGYDDDGTGTDPIGGGVFFLSAMIGLDGEATGGSLDIDGTIGGFGLSLLEGDLVDFGFIDGGGQILEFLFEVTGGDLASDYGGVGTVIGVILDANGTYSGDWTQDFSAFGGVSDTAALAVPTPGSLVLLCGAALTARRRRRA